MSTYPTTETREAIKNRLRESFCKPKQLKTVDENWSDWTFCLKEAN